MVLVTISYCLIKILAITTPSLPTLTLQPQEYSADSAAKPQGYITYIQIERGENGEGNYKSAALQFHLGWKHFTV